MDHPSKVITTGYISPEVPRLKDEVTQKGDPRFRQLLDDMWEMHCRKGNDYGSGEDFLANLRASEAYGVPAWIGALIRANDKMIRLENAAKGVMLANESVEDSLMDLACYALLSLILYKETLPKEIVKDTVTMGEIFERVKAKEEMTFNDNS